VFSQSTQEPTQASPAILSLVAIQLLVACQLLAESHKLQASTPKTQLKLKIQLTICQTNQSDKETMKTPCRSIQLENEDESEK
jgi:hypothetical protein